MPLDMIIMLIIVVIWLIICDYYKEKFKFKGRRNNPFIIGSMPYVFLSIMLISGIKLNDYEMLLMALMGLIVVSIATVYAMHKIKKENYPLDGSLKVGKWIMFPGIVFLVFIFLLGGCMHIYH